jgi:thiamine transport system ATP-binding protein
MLQVRNLTVRFGEVIAVAGIDIDIADGSVVAIVGPSGCGKTTVLRAIAGLQPVDSGTVRWDGEPVGDVPVHRRGFGLMFQDYALFPHRDVAANVAFGLRMQHRAAAAIDEGVARALDMVGLAEYADRAVGTLSGGEQQRVALARALAPAPRLLMLDEPIGALDRSLRERLMVEFHELFARHAITALYVTHDQEEAFAVADRIIVMDRGAIVQEGTPEHVWRRPATEFVARFLGFPNIVPADLGSGAADTGWSVIPVATEATGRRNLVLRPDDFTVTSDGAITATVLDRTFRSGAYHLTVRPAGGPDLAVVLPTGPTVGTELRLDIAPEAIVVLDA